MEGKFSRSSLLLSGGGGGIALATAKLAAENGTPVILADIGRGFAEASKLAAHTPLVNAYECDVTNPDACEALYQTITTNHSELPLMVATCAGITRDGFFHKLSLADQRLVMEINYWGAVNIITPFYRRMREESWGRIVLISSVNGQKGQASQTNYAASKAALIGFGKSLAQEGARKNITVNMICPGYVNTAMTKKIPPDVLSEIIKQIPEGRMAEPEEIGHWICSLLPDNAAFETGSALTPNGGMYM